MFYARGTGKFTKEESKKIMLDQLVESKNHGKENRVRHGLFALSALMMMTLLLGGMVWSIFAKEFNIAGDALELSTLVTPVPLDANEPLPEPPAPKQEKAEQPKADKEMVIKRQTNTLQIDETPVKAPEKVSVTKNTQKARPNTAFVVDENASETESVGSTSGTLNRGAGSGTNTEGTGFSNAVNNSKPAETEVAETKTTPPPPPPVKKEIPKPKPPTMISKGVVNGQAVSLPKPVYPPPARAIGAKGAVNVQITIDENGNVISANAVSGHPLLRSVAEQAAQNAKFRPTLLSGEPVKVKGMIVYNFTG